MALQLYGIQTQQHGQTLHTVAVWLGIETAARTAVNGSATLQPKVLIMQQVFAEFICVTQGIFTNC